MTIKATGEIFLAGRANVFGFNVDLDYCRKLTDWLSVRSTDGNWVRY